MSPLFCPFFARQPAVILDGALATELERRGAQIQGHPLWSAKILLQRPELIEQVHYDYFCAGADVGISASYQATLPGLAALGLGSEEAARLLLSSVDLVRQARDRFWDQWGGSDRLSPLVAASIGPYGAYLADGSEYSGDYGLSVTDLMDFHRPRMQILAHSGADLLACETIPSLAEAQALVQLLTEFPHMPAWISFSCRDEARICHGESFRECVALVGKSAQVVAVGVNCTDPAYVGDLLTGAAGVTEKPLLAYPNRGEVWDGVHNCWLPRTADNQETLASLAADWVAAGACLVGGCCRTTPADIAALRKAIMNPFN